MAFFNYTLSHEQFKNTTFPVLSCFVFLLYTLETVVLIQEWKISPFYLFGT